MDLINNGLAFVLGGFLFWPVLLVSLLLVLVLVERDHEFWSLLFSGAALYLIFNKWGSVSALLADWQVAGIQIGLTLKIVGYFILGLVWSVIHWVLVNRHNASVFRDVKNDIIQRNGYPTNIFTREYLETLLVANQSWMAGHQFDIKSFPLSAGLLKSSNPPVEIEQLNRAYDQLKTNLFQNHSEFQRNRLHGDTPWELLESIKPKASSPRMRSAIMVWIFYWPFSIVWYLIRDFAVQATTFIIQNLGKTFSRISNAIFKDVL